MVLHDHQANPHVHLSVRAESKHGKRLNPRKADLQRWRETFAERLRELGHRRRGDASGHPRRRSQLPGALAHQGARGGQSARSRDGSARSAIAALASRRSAGQAWGAIATALRASPDPKDQRLAHDIKRFVTERTLDRSVVKEQTRLPQEPQRDIGWNR